MLARAKTRCQDRTRYWGRRMGRQHRCAAAAAAPSVVSGLTRPRPQPLVAVLIAARVCCCQQHGLGKVRQSLARAWHAERGRSSLADKTAAEAKAGQAAHRQGSGQARLP